MAALFEPARLSAFALFLLPALLLAVLQLVPRWRRADPPWFALLLAALPFAIWLVLCSAEPSIELTWLFAASACFCFLLLTMIVLVSGSAWVVPSSLAALAIGAWLLPTEDFGLWLLAGSWLLPVVLGLILIVSGLWWNGLGYAAFFLALACTAGWASPALGDKLLATGQSLASVQLAVTEPWWLLLLLLLPLLVWFSYRSLAGLGPQRRWIALGLRCFLIALVACALADVHLRHGSERMTVLFLWDRSLSIPADIAEGSNEDLRERRIKRFINDSVLLRDTKQKEDGAGLIVFGKHPRLELPPASVPHFNELKSVQSKIDDSYTDIAAALKLALASFPEGTGKRVVLISDGNENVGNAEEQARIARQNGVQIDVVPLASGRRNPNEVLVERIEAPAVTEKDSRLPLRVLLRSFNPNIVVGKLQLSRTSLEPRGEGFALERVDFPEEEVQLRLGLNVFYLKQPGIKREESYAYEAKFIPLGVLDPRDKSFTKGLPGDKLENNRAGTTVVARGERAILMIEPKLGEHKLLLDRLRVSKPHLKIRSMEPGDLPRDPDNLNLLLSRFDCVILANLPADRLLKIDGGEERVVEGLTVEQQKVLRSNVQDQGCGMIVIGGPDSFGAGGWQNSELEKAWPVTCELEALKVEKKSGLVLIMHASEIAQGNMWQKKIARLAVDKLAPIDMIGLMHWEGLVGAVVNWHIPFQEVGPNREKILKLLDTMDPGDMIEAEPFLKEAFAALGDPKHDLGTKHIIFISDGDHWKPPAALLKKIGAAKITCTTVCITSHGQAEVQQMKLVAQLTGGRSYHVKDPNDLPAIYIKETRLISKAYVHDKAFLPVLRKAVGPTKDLQEDLKPLHGFVRTTPRATPLVDIPIITPKIGDSTFPILAHWQYGLGRVAVFTSDARTHPVPPKEKVSWWDRDWASSTMYIQFWDQVVDWTLRSVGNEKNLFLTTEQSGDRIKVIVTARDDKDQPLTDLELHGGLTSPSLKETNPRRPVLKFEQKNVGVYEAEIKAEEIGSYFLHVRATRKKEGGEEIVGSVRTGLTVPYSPEFAEMDSNAALLERLREITGGKTIAEDAVTLNRVAQSGELFRPAAVRSKAMQAIWFWLVFLAGIALFFDVAARRISLEPGEVVGPLRGLWSRMRGQAAAAATTPQFLDRLRSRKAEVAQGLAPSKAEMRFDATDAPVAPVPGADQPTAAPTAPPTDKPKPPPSVAPESPEETGDFASRLMRAKKRAMEERDKKKDSD